MIKDTLLGQGLELISLKDIVIAKDDSKTTGYDFTVEDWYTFSTADGVFVQDTISVYCPLTKEAQEDCKKLLPSNCLFNDANRQIGVTLGQNFTLTIYHMTISVSPSPTKDKLPMEKEKRIDFSQKVAVKGEVTTVGRWLVTLALRKATLDKKYPLVVEPVTKKLFGKLLLHLYNAYGKESVVSFLEEVRTLVVEYSWSLPDVFLDIRLSQEAGREVKSLMEQLRQSPDAWETIVEVVRKDVRAHSKDLYYLIESKSTKFDWNKLVQALVAKGYIVTLDGKHKLISSSQLDGLTSGELVDDSTNGRQGVIDRALITGKAGYLTRKLVYGAATVLLNDTIQDCGTGRVLNLIVTKAHVPSLVGRYILLNGKLVVVDEQLSKDLVGSKIKLRSPAFCRTKKVCPTCYGTLSESIPSKNIGIIAAQALGERANQMIMRTFHVDTLVTAESEVASPDVAGFKLTEDGYVAQEDLSIVINKEDIEDRNDFQIVTDGLEVNGKYVNTRFYISLLSVDDIKETGESIEVFFSKGAIPMHVAVVSKLREQIAIVGGLFELKKALHIKDALALLGKVFDEYVKMNSNIDHVHFEIIIGQMMRAKSNLFVPFRLAADLEIALLPLSKIPFYESPQLSLAFQKVSESLLFGLYRDIADVPEEERTKADLEEYFY